MSSSEPITNSRGCAAIRAAKESFFARLERHSEKLVTLGLIGRANTPSATHSLKQSWYPRRSETTIKSMSLPDLSLPLATEP